MLDIYHKAYDMYFVVFYGLMDIKCVKRKYNGRKETYCKPNISHVCRFACPHANKIFSR